ncbi:protein IMPACT-B-like [Ptychodera flava]|uniref:protein IMPACT-B-like n=1 Tax=Ptychodera flava TaxID=63121 RepID=UPI00396A73D8
MDMDDCLTRQIDEIEALSAIYGEEWCVVDEGNRIYCIAISDEKKPPACQVCLQVLFPENYPNTSSPLFQVNASWLKEEERGQVEEDLNQICKDNIGESVIYLMVEKLREFIEKKSEQIQSEDTTESAKELGEEEEEEVTETETEDAVQYQIDSNDDVEAEVPEIHHAEPLTDRRSTFQGHLAKVTNVQQVKAVLSELLQNRKIANATHNILAYRIYCENRNTFREDCDDDGETAAGGRLLHLLQILDVRNVMVVVSRWYGGILLGPDRFKHINNAARNVLQDNGYIEKKDEKTKTKHTKHKKTR